MQPDERPPSVPADGYLIRKGGAYYRPLAAGYTRNPTEAGRFSLAQAESYSHPNGPDGPRDGIDYVHESEVPAGEDPLRAPREAFLNMLADARDFHWEPDGDETGDHTTACLVTDWRQFAEVAEALGIKGPGYDETWSDAIDRAIAEPPTPSSTEVAERNERGQTRAEYFLDPDGDGSV